MSSFSASEAFEVLRFAQSFAGKLEQAAAEVQKRFPRGDELAWAEQATSRVQALLPSIAATIERARALPDLADAMERLAEEDQGRWVDALEKLVAGITFTASSRSPLIEALFPHQKWPALRRAFREDVTKYANEFERRAKTAYVTRLLGQEELAVVRPVMDQVAAAYARWQACFSPSELPAEQAEALRAELTAAAEKVDLATRQARLLAEAALLAAPGVFDDVGLHAKPKKGKAPAAKQPEPEVAAPEPEPEPEPVKVAAPLAEKTEKAPPKAKKPRGKKAAEQAGASTGSPRAESSSSESSSPALPEAPSEG